MRPYPPGEDLPAGTSFRCPPVVQPGSDENAAGFPSVRRGDSVWTPTGRSERFLGEPPIRRTLFDISDQWCPAGTPPDERGTTFSSAFLMPSRSSLGSLLSRFSRDRYRRIAVAKLFGRLAIPGFHSSPTEYRFPSKDRDSLNRRSMSVCPDSVSGGRMPVASNSERLRSAAFRQSSVLTQWTLHSRSCRPPDLRSPTRVGSPRLPDHHLRRELPAFQGSGNNCPIQ
ncbi:hypothetical protein T4A_1949 [Trichinella pseudospiralis]|uniref:Uncharacterized protein n=1 Tax=Trichinella pseudospiralis TaxID=6337 RepID=A0A0V1ER47_TRIPS|nr:hypothetical protein T4A_1949 [Trichinella pseudospiralis]